MLAFSGLSRSVIFGYIQKANCYDDMSLYSMFLRPGQYFIPGYEQNAFTSTRCLADLLPPYTQLREQPLPHISQFLSHISNIQNGLPGKSCLISCLWSLKGAEQREMFGSLRKSLIFEYIPKCHDPYE